MSLTNPGGKKDLTMPVPNAQLPTDNMCMASPSHSTVCLPVGMIVFTCAFLPRLGLWAPGGQETCLASLSVPVLHSEPGSELPMGGCLLKEEGACEAVPAEL